VPICIELGKELQARIRVRMMIQTQKQQVTNFASMPSNRVLDNSWDEESTNGGIKAPQVDEQEALHSLLCLYCRYNRTNIDTSKLQQRGH
jgi:hypothetical protein